ncbi:MAG: orotate phosphoribosyltransferase [bacterium]|nr:orotate phosphoribosyltransferase [bacterium]
MNTAKEIAKILLEIKAVTLNVKEPYRYTSGILSPIYCDNRLIMSYPDKRQIVIDAFLNLIKTNNLNFEVLAGTATAGIPHAAWLSDRLNQPMIYVRGKSKEHGKQNQIEGKLNKGQKSLVVEDLISTGGSSVDAGLALREAGAEVTDCIAIFTYQMKKAEDLFQEAKIEIHTLSNFATLIDVAEEEGYITEDEKKTALEWNQDPAGWGKKMGYE